MPFSSSTLSLLLICSLGLAIVRAVPLPTPLPQPLQIPGVGGLTLGYTDGKLTAGLSVKYSGKPLGQSVTGLLSLGGDINTSNFIEGGIQEADTESIDLPLLTVIDGGAYSRPVDVSATINPTLLSADGLIGLVNGGFLGQSFTVLGGFPTAGINAKGQGTIDPTGYVAYGPAAASGAIEAGIDPKTGAGAKASGAFHLNLGQDLGQVGGKASISLGIDSKGLEFGGLTVIGSAFNGSFTIPIPAIGHQARQTITASPASPTA